MMDRRKLSSMLLVAAALAAVPAVGQPSAPVDSAPAGAAADVLLDGPFRNSTEGVEFRPPAGGILNRQLGTGEIVRFAYPDRAWTLTLKSVINSTHMMLASNPGIPGNQGLVDVAVSQLTDRGGMPATVLRRDVLPMGPRLVGLIEAQDHAGIEPLFVQVALVPEKGNGRYFILQMVTKGQAVPKDQTAPKNQPSVVSDAAMAAARQAFQASLASMELFDRSVLRQEQEQRLHNTRWLWLQIKQPEIERAIQTIHYMRVVRDGHDVGYVQVNERTEKHHGHDGVYVVSRQHVALPPAEQAAANPAAAPLTATPGLNLPPPAAGTASAAAAAAPRELDRDTRLFVTFDRDHEDWVALDTLDHRAMGQTLELGNNDRVVRVALDRLAAAQMQSHAGGDKQPPTTQRVTDTLQVDNYRRGDQGMKATGPTVHLPVPPWYLPQALAQLLPRLLPVDAPNKYLFAFYVSAQRQMLYRYVDVGAEQEVTLDGRKVRAVPITDRIGADGLITTHYVSRDDHEWFGTVSDDGKLVVLPTDEATLRQTWREFKVLDDPIPPTDDDAGPIDPTAPRIHLKPMDQQPSAAPQVDAGPFGGR